MKNKGLGKGLAALISEQNLMTEPNGNDRVVKLAITEIVTNKFQPRKSFNDESIRELAQSIRKHGIIQPIIVRSNLDEKYEIIAGERRWRAAQLASLTEIPVIIKKLNATETAEQALIENIQREDLNPVDEANAYSELMSKYNYKQEELSDSLGKSRSHIANMLRITSLPDSVKQLLVQGMLSFSHAKLFAGHQDAEEIGAEIAAKSLSVRQAEHLIKSWEKLKAPKEKPAKAPEDKANHSDDYSNIAASITNTTGLKCAIEPKGSSGKVVINYNNFLQLDKIIDILSRE